MGESKKSKPALPSIDEVFPLRGVPEYTYQRREDLERRILEYSTSGTGVALVHGPTKSGKSVLVQKTLLGQPGEALYVYAPDAETRDEFWTVANALLGTFTGRAKGKGSLVGHDLETRGEVTGIWAKLGFGHKRRAEETHRDDVSATDPANIVVTRELLRTGRTLIIDDLHMLERKEQRRIMLSLKPFVDQGGRLIVIAAGHRAELIPPLVPNMAGSFVDFAFSLWGDNNALANIALEGWEKLNYHPDADFAQKLALNSFGSPQIMQRLSAHLIRHNGHTKAAETPNTVLQWPTDEDDFFRGLLSEKNLEVSWLKKLTRGPAGRARAKYITHADGPADGYRLIILALRSLLPRMDHFQSDLQRKVVELTVADAPIEGKVEVKVPVLSTPRPGETTSKLDKMAEMARRPLSDHASEDELDKVADEVSVDPVLEYRGKGANARIQLVDPLFAYALRWWSHN